MDYQEKYLKYKNKYLQLRDQLGGCNINNVVDKQAALTAVTTNGLALVDHFGCHNDIQIVTTAITNNPLAIQYASQSFIQSNIDLVKTTLSKDITIFIYLPDNIKNNKEIKKHIKHNKLISNWAKSNKSHPNYDYITNYYSQKPIKNYWKTKILNWEAKIRKNNEYNSCNYAHLTIDGMTEEDLKKYYCEYCYLIVWYIYMTITIIKAMRFMVPDDQNFKVIDIDLNLMQYQGDLFLQKYTKAYNDNIDTDMVIEKYKSDVKTQAQRDYDSDDYMEELNISNYDVATVKLLQTYFNEYKVIFNTYKTHGDKYFKK
jgi:hypothetical protein